MKFRTNLLTTILIGGCMAMRGAAQQADKQPIVSSTGRFGDPNIRRAHVSGLYVWSGQRT